MHQGNIARHLEEYRKFGMVEGMAFLSFVAVAIVTWYFASSYFSDPKRQIERLWKEIHGYALEIGKHKDDEYMSSFVRELYKERTERAGALINRLLDYHFADSVEDDEVAEYISDNRYGNSHQA